MIRANIRNAMGVYVGLIDETEKGFRIVWNENPDSATGIDIPECNRLFTEYEAVCAAVLRIDTGARISETIYFRLPLKGKA